MSNEYDQYLVIVGFTVCQALPFIMAMSKKWFFTLGTNKMLKKIAKVIFESPYFICKLNYLQKRQMEI